MDRDVEMDDMRVGTAPWVQRTAGRLTEAERRALLWPLARSHAQNAVGRLRFAVGLHPGRHATVLPARLAPPVTVLTGAAEECAKRVLPVSLLNHSYRTYVFVAPSASSKASTWTASCCSPARCCTTPAWWTPSARPTSPSPPRGSHGRSPKR